MSLGGDIRRNGEREEVMEVASSRLVGFALTSGAL